MTRELPPSAGFPSRSRSVAPSAPPLGRPFGQPPPSAAVKERKMEEKNWGACGAPNGFENVTRSTRNPNMCLVLKSDNGKVGRLRHPMFQAPSAPFSAGTCGAHGFKNFRRVIRIPNMCLVLKLDNGKVVSIANGQTHRVTQPSSTVLVYRCVC